MNAAMPRLALERRAEGLVTRQFDCNAFRLVLYGLSNTWRINGKARAYRKTDREV